MTRVSAVGLGKCLKKAEETEHCSGGRTERLVRAGEKEAMSMWLSCKLHGSGMGEWGGQGQGPRGRAADLPGVLRSRVRDGHSLQTKRGRSSAERSRTVWQGGRSGWPSQAGGQEVPGGHCPPGPLLGRKGRRLWLGMGLAISLPRRKLSSVSSFISRPTSSWQWRKEELAAGRKVWRASVARVILRWGQERVRDCHPGSHPSPSFCLAVPRALASALGVFLTPWNS